MPPFAYEVIIMADVVVEFFKGFIKKPNSTLLPINQQEQVFRCRLINNVSMLAPVIAVYIEDSNDETKFNIPITLNYAYIADFNRYYWVFDWTFSDGLWVAQLQVDVLASYKQFIAAGTMFCDRCADRLAWRYVNNVRQLVVTDTGLPDDLIPTVSRPHVEKETLSIPGFQSSFDSGCYILGMINSDDTSVGSLSYYALTPRMFKHFMHAMLSTTDYMGTLNINSETAKAILNPFQYVATCNWFPFPVSVVGQSATKTGLKFGWWTLNSIEYHDIIQAGVVERGLAMRMRDHIYASELNMSIYNYEPYATYKLELPYFGSVILNRSDFPTGQISLLMSFDLITGLAQCRIYHIWPSSYNPSTDGGIINNPTDIISSSQCALIRTLSGQASAPIQIAQTTSDFGAARVAQVQASSTQIANSALLRKEYATARSQGIMSIIGGAIGAVAGLFTGGAAAVGGVAGVVSGIGQIQAAKQAYNIGAQAVNAQNRAAAVSGAYSASVAKAPKVETSGSNGSILESKYPAVLISEFMIPSSIQDHNYDAHTAWGSLEDTRTIYELNGYPYGEYIRVDEHSGYLQGHDPIVYCPQALQPEIDQIKEYMCTGFFYE